MGINAFQIVGIIVFVISSSAANITFTQLRKHAVDRIGMFRDQTFLVLVFFSASLLFIGSLIYLVLSSWLLFLIVALITIVLTPLIINPFVLRFVIFPLYKKLLRWVEKREESNGN